MQIIIPMSGLGSRFVKQNYKDPKPFPNWITTSVGKSSKTFPLMSYSLKIYLFTMHKFT